MRVLVCLLLAALVGCATGGNPAALADAGRSLTCRDQAQCDRYWQRARQWVAENTRSGIHTETKWVIVSDYPSDLGFTAGYTVTKTAADEGGEVIVVSVACATFLPCVPSRASLIERFKQYVTAP